MGPGKAWLLADDRQQKQPPTDRRQAFLLQVLHGIASASGPGGRRCEAGGDAAYAILLEPAGEDLR